MAGEDGSMSQLEDKYKGEDGAVRLAVFQVSYQFLEMILRGQFNKTATFTTDVPEDLHIMAVKHSFSDDWQRSHPDTRCFEILAASSEWDEVPPGAEIPIKAVVVRAEYDSRDTASVEPERFKKPDEKAKSH
jgi:hypothetical protein